MRTLHSIKRDGGRISAALATLYCLAGAAPALAQDIPPETEEAPLETETTPPQTDEMPLEAVNASPEPEESGSGTEIFSEHTLSLLFDGRFVAADGRESWLEGGLGKTRFDGSSDGDLQFRPVPVEAILMWQPRLTDSLGASVSAGWQRGQENAIDLFEAFVTFQPGRTARTRFLLRAGLFWPNISLEHAGAAWSVTDTITPSAINSWVGEEVKVLGLEGTLTTAFGEHEVSATGAAFGFNDTAGTLLSFRGWALHDIKAGAFGHHPVPPLNDFIVHLQSRITRPFIELDDRVGFYGQIVWRPPLPFAFDILYYDNRGDPKAFNTDLQWGWRTKFLNVGANADLGPSTRLLAQAMTGTTLMGFQTGGVEWVDTRFRSVYVLVRHEIGRGAVTGRIDWFDTRERGSQMAREESEDGWALTAAGRYTVTDNAVLFLEAMHVRSDRGTRRGLGLPPVEHQTVLQAALRITL